MDASSTSQSLAQAVQAATQQAQQAQSQPSPTPQPAVQSSSSIDNLTCQWQGCGERTDSAEALYDHVCERHVGRKSTNNLNLTCQWGACRTTTVKRDHITSHIRVHVPLKPHKCDFCGKAFKRPQDLKKHVKTHADDSVLSGSPHQGQNGRSSMGNNGLGQNGKPSGYYAASHDGGMPAYTYAQPGLTAGGANGAGYHQAPNSQYAGYGSVSYPNSAAIAEIQSMDTRRRAIEALNDFLGDIKRRAINPSTYYDVGQRLQGTSLPLPVGTGYNTGYNSSNSTYNGMSAASLLEAFNHGELGGGGNNNNNINNSNGGGVHGPVAQSGYSLPLPNARTKNDLQDIDRFLEQLQATVYETSNQAAAAGVQQPGMHAHYAGDYGMSNNPANQYHRSSHSPPSFPLVGGASSFGAISMPGTTSAPASTGFDTPALTPASVSSYSSSGQSPLSNHGSSSLGSNNMYPSLPSVTSMSDIGSGYPATTSAPASSLASGFQGLDERRYSGGRLQRVAPSQEPRESPDTEMGETDDGSSTPKPEDSKRLTSEGNSSIDPALRGADSPDAASTPAARSTDGDDKRQEDWVENIRAIEALRKWISSRLEQGDFESEAKAEKASSPAAKASEEGTATNTVETANIIEEKMADADLAEKSADSDVKYPTLPGA